MATRESGTEAMGMRQSHYIEGAPLAFHFKTDPPPRGSGSTTICLNSQPVFFLNKCTSTRAPIYQTMHAHFSSLALP